MFSMFYFDGVLLSDKYLRTILYRTISKYMYYRNQFYSTVFIIEQFIFKGNLAGKNISVLNIKRLTEIWSVT